MASRSKKKATKRAKIVEWEIPLGGPGSRISPVVSGGEPEHKLPEGPPKSLTEEEALDVLWSAKNCFQLDEEGHLKLIDGKPVPNPNWCDAFVYATLKSEVEKSEYRPFIAAGTRVLVTMVSRFGDVGIRAHHLVPPSNGYDARVLPEHLTDWSTHP